MSRVPRPCEVGPGCKNAWPDSPCCLERGEEPDCGVLGLPLDFVADREVERQTEIKLDSGPRSRPSGLAD